MGSKRWSSKEELEVVSLALKGLTVSAIAKKLERSSSSVESRLKIISNKLNKVAKQTPAKRVATQSRQGRRKHLGISVRSSWEANFLTMLNKQKIKWDYEPKMFIFEDVQRGTRAYLPDVYLPKKDIWIEVKGRLRPQDKTKIRRFKKYYPEEFAKLQCVVQNEKVEAARFFESMQVPVYAYYDDMQKKYSSLKNWE